MSFYWAKFIKSEGYLFRMDTRVYLTDINKPSDSDKCVGAVVAKNPGSAKPSDFQQLGELSEINLGKDKLLSTVRNIILKSADIIEGKQYIQVLNLFYLCNPDLLDAIAQINKINSFLVCPSEIKKFPWVWFLWGGSDKYLNPFKGRFNNIDSPKKFFYVEKEKELRGFVPKDQDKARHTQGMTHEEVIPLLKKIINS